LLGLLSMAAAGCANTPQLESQSAAVPARARLDASISGTKCSPCADQTREIERLRLEVSSRDAELRELRSSQRDQVKVLQESKREVTRAKVKVRRLATRADAASYIAEIEVAMASLRASTGGRSIDPRIVQAQRLLDSTDTPFAQGDYAVAMDRAAEAEQLIVSASDAATQRSSLARAKMESRPGVKLSTATIAAKPRGRHPANARNAATQKQNRPSVASGDRRSWMQAGTEGR
jgi:hypothetical protein